MDLEGVFVVRVERRGAGHRPEGRAPIRGASALGPTHPRHQAMTLAGAHPVLAPRASPRYEDAPRSGGSPCFCGADVAADERSRHGSRF